MVGNNCVGCYWPKSSSPYEQERRFMILKMMSSTSLPRQTSLDDMAVWLILSFLKAAGRILGVYLGETGEKVPLLGLEQGCWPG